MKKGKVYIINDKVFDTASFTDISEWYGLLEEYGREIARYAQQIQDARIAAQIEHNRLPQKEWQELNEIYATLLYEYTGIARSILLMFPKESALFSVVMCSLLVKKDALLYKKLYKQTQKLLGE
jgi:hypothetical protein